ncbi:hypothetical protein CYMTET_20308 [Cymbomonas tetramitiformis]|uniref:Uncharacterized protein n=1 Tax=Cymbomonas tetramitiformis TaxID=36881 RepID=A0AAE0G500_9CHLO|nr:hypothetical protein CYMTET_20308 [Cymbomonas tetramitiformis]
MECQREDVPDVSTIQEAPSRDSGSVWTPRITKIGSILTERILSTKLPRVKRKKWSMELIIHFCLAIVIAMNLLILAGNHFSYLRTAKFAFQRLFLEAGAECGQKILIFSTLRECVRNVEYRFKDLLDDGLSPFELEGLWPKSPDTLLKLHLTLLDDGGQVLNISAASYSLHCTKHSYDINRNNLPFGDAAFLLENHTMPYALRSVELEMRFRDNNFYNGEKVCLEWYYFVTFDVLATSGILRPVVSFSTENCSLAS